MIHCFSWLLTLLSNSGFKRIRIGFCHRHFLKKPCRDLPRYRKETGCDRKTVSSLYAKVKEILATASSQTASGIRLNGLRDEAFEHPLPRKRIDSMKSEAVHCACSKRRKGIAPPTSFVDGFLKIVKRKLRQVESFRDREWTRLTFRAMANARNFLPSAPGAKNAHRSPFMLAEGETFGLPWIEIMNMHNAFLFSENAF